MSVQSGLAPQGSSVEQVGSWGRASIEFATDDVGDDSIRRAAAAADANHGFYRACVEGCVGKGPVAETRTDGRSRHGGRGEQSESRKANLRSHQLMANERPLARFLKFSTTS